jgi:ferredoxin
MRYRIEVDEDLCAGSGICAIAAPDYFEMDEAHVARPLRPVTDASAEVLAAAENCPLDAIAVYDADTGEPL